MSVWTWAYGNHKINYDVSEEQLISECLAVLNKSKVVEGEWKFKEKLDFWEDGNPEYVFVAGKYDIAVTRNYLFFGTNCFPWTHWFSPYDEEEEQLRSFWLRFIRSLTKAFGGDVVSYFPDNLFASHALMPSEHRDQSFQDSLKMLYDNHQYIYGSVEEAREADVEDPVIVEYL